ncbi:MAG: hypothetical protein C0P79_012775 [Gammaproteobacteria bacterium]
MNHSLFGKPRTSDVSIQAKIVELERELKKRKYVYPRLIKKNRLDRRTAEERILVLEAILEDYYQMNREGRRA